MGSIMVERLHCPICKSKKRTTLISTPHKDPKIDSFLRGRPHLFIDWDVIADELFEIVECKRCTFTYHRYVPNDKTLDLMYNEWIRGKTNLQRKLGVDFKYFQYASLLGMRIKKAFKIKGHDVSNIRVLEFGSGWGNILKHMRLQGFDVTGSEIGRTQIEHCEKEYKIRMRDFDKLLKDKEKFDVIMSFQVLEHVVDIDETVEKLTSMLKPGGIFIVEVPDCTNTRKLIRMRKYKPIHPLYHVNNFTVRSLRNLFGKYGLKKIGKPLVWTGTTLKDVVIQTLVPLHDRFTPTTSLFFRKESK